MKRSFENTEQEITKPSTSKAGVLSPIDPENSAETTAKSLQPNISQQRPQWSLTGILFKMGEKIKKKEKPDLRAKYPARTALQGLTPPAAAGKQKALYKQLDHALSFH